MAGVELTGGSRRAEELSVEGLSAEGMRGQVADEMRAKQLRSWGLRGLGLVLSVAAVAVALSPSATEPLSRSASQLLTASAAQPLSSSAAQGQAAELRHLQQLVIARRKASSVAAQPSAAQPPAAQPQVAQPPAAQHPAHGAQPQVAQRAVAQPSAAQPKAAQPTAAQPQSEEQRMIAEEDAKAGIAAPQPPQPQITEAQRQAQQQASLIQQQQAQIQQQHQLIQQMTGLGQQPAAQPLTPQAAQTQYPQQQAYQYPQPQYYQQAQYQQYAAEQQQYAQGQAQYQQYSQAPAMVATQAPQKLAAQQQEHLLQGRISDNRASVSASNIAKEGQKLESISKRSSIANQDQSSGAQDKLFKLFTAGPQAPKPKATGPLVFQSVPAKPQVKKLSTQDQLFNIMTGRTPEAPKKPTAMEGAEKGMFSMWQNAGHPNRAKATEEDPNQARMERMEADVRQADDQAKGSKAKLSIPNPLPFDYSKSSSNQADKGLYALWSSAGQPAVQAKPTDGAQGKGAASAEAAYQAFGIPDGGAAVPV